MRAVAIFAVGIAACATAKTAPGDTATARSGEEAEAPEPAHLPDAPPPEIARRIIEAQKASHANVTDAIAIVELNLRSRDEARVRAALAVLEAMAASMAQIDRDSDDGFLFYSAYHVDFLADQVNTVLDERYETAPCSVMPQFARVAGAFRRLPGFHAPKAHFRGPRENRLSTRAVACGMRAIDEKIAACHARFQVAGNATVDVMVNRAGAVTHTAAVGAFANTPTGDCVAAAAMTATFPVSDGFAGLHTFVLK